MSCEEGTRGKSLQGSRDSWPSPKSWLVRCFSARPVSTVEGGFRISEVAGASSHGSTGHNRTPVTSPKPEAVLRQSSAHGGCAVRYGEDCDRPPPTAHLSPSRNTCLHLHRFCGYPVTAKGCHPIPNLNVLGGAAWLWQGNRMAGSSAIPTFARLDQWVHSRVGAQPNHDSFHKQPPPKSKNQDHKFSSSQSSCQRRGHHPHLTSLGRTCTLPFLALGGLNSSICYLNLDANSVDTPRNSSRNRQSTWQ
jgi:hypothetical protein